MRRIDRLYAARDRLLANPEFQRWAAAFPLTRGIARRRASAIFDLTAGFVYSQILSACVQLRLLEQLRDGPLTAQTLAPKLALDTDAATTLLKAAAAIGLVATRGTDDSGDSRYGLGMDGAALLGNPGALAMIAHHDRFYADLADPVALLRGEGATQLAQFWPYAGNARGNDDCGSRAYTRLMSASQSLVSSDILDAYDFSRHRHLLDLGGGDGTFLAAALARSPSLQGTVLDLPSVAVQAEARFAAEGFAARATAAGGDLWHAVLPGGADVVSLVRVLHDHDDARVASLLKRVIDVLPRDGVLVIAEPMVADAATHRVGHAYFGFYLRAMGSGRARTLDEYRRALLAAGACTITHVKTRRPLLCSLLVARR